MYYIFMVMAVIHDDMFKLMIDSKVMAAICCDFWW